MHRATVSSRCRRDGADRPAVTGASNSGNTSGTDLTFAGRLTYGQGLYTHLFGFGGTYTITEGDRTESSAFGIYEGSRDFGAQFYGFGTGRFNYDRFGSVRA